MCDELPAILKLHFLDSLQRSQPAENHPLPEHEPQPVGLHNKLLPEHFKVL
jgi:hypothetical protein